MTTVETVLIIVLAIGFLALLILSIILVSVMIAIMRNVKRISDRAEEATGNIAGIAAMVSRRLAPLAVSGAMAAAMKWVKKRAKHND